MHAMSYPTHLLQNIAWACRRERYPDRQAFGAQVQAYNDEIMKARSAWSPNEVVLRAPRVEIQFMCWTEDGSEQPEPVITLDADDGAAFTQLELLHGLCDQIGAILLDRNLHLYDHCFFEGLSGGGDQAFYSVWFGS